MAHHINITNITANHPGYAVVLRWQVEDVIGFTAVHTFKPNNVAGGGTRILPYPTEQDALNDALALALTMTKKMKTAGVAIGGAKTVVRVKQLDAQQKRLGLWGVAEIVKHFEGRLLTGSDLNTGNDEIELLHSFVMSSADQLQRCIVRESEAKVSQATAYGVVGALQAVLQTLHLPGRPKITVQGKLYHLYYTHIY
jgi:leucine dehydrogenase